MNITEAFNRLITLYDVCDELEISGSEETADTMRQTLNDLSKFMVSLMETEINKHINKN